LANPDVSFLKLKKKYKFGIYRVSQEQCKYSIIESQIMICNLWSRTSRRKLESRGISGPQSRNSTKL